MGIFDDFLEDAQEFGQQFVREAKERPLEAAVSFGTLTAGRATGSSEFKTGDNVAEFFGQDKEPEDPFEALDDDEQTGKDEVEAEKLKRGRSGAGGGSATSTVLTQRQTQPSLLG